MWLRLVLNYLYERSFLNYNLIHVSFILFSDNCLEWKILLVVCFNTLLWLEIRLHLFSHWRRYLNLFLHLNKAIILLVSRSSACVNLLRFSFWCLSFANVKHKVIVYRKIKNRILELDFVYSSYKLACKSWFFNYRLLLCP